MPEHVRPPPPEVVDEIRREANRQLTREEFLAYVDAPMGEWEREEMDGLIDWFARRCPTPEARADWAQAVYAQMAETMPKGANDY